MYLSRVVVTEQLGFDGPPFHICSQICNCLISTSNFVADDSIIVVNQVGDS